MEVVVPATIPEPTTTTTALPEPILPQPAPAAPAPAPPKTPLAKLNKAINAYFSRNAGTPRNNRAGVLGTETPNWEVRSAKAKKVARLIAEIHIEKAEAAEKEEDVEMGKKDEPLVALSKSPVGRRHLEFAPEVIEAQPEPAAAAMEPVTLVAPLQPRITRHPRSRPEPVVLQPRITRLRKKMSDETASGSTSTLHSPQSSSEPITAKPNPTPALFSEQNENAPPNTPAPPKLNVDPEILKQLAINPRLHSQSGILKYVEELKRDEERILGLIEGLELGLGLRSGSVEV